MSKKTSKGITLIALIITIIVLLILAGVTISILTGENGILNRAVSAREKMQRGEIIEDLQLKIYEKQSYNNGEIAENELVEILEEVGTLTDEENIFDRTLTTYKGNYDIEVSEIWNGQTKEKTVMEYAKQAMPTGAHIDENTNEYTGIVMIDENKNEWVWIEVPKEVFETAKSNTDYDNIKEDLIKYAEIYREGRLGHGRYWPDEWYDYLGTTYDGKNEFSQVKYITSNTYFTKAKNYYGTIYKDNQGTQIADSYEEGITYYAKITDKINDTSGCGLTYEEYIANYKKMLSSIYTNKGFYIARYEAGIEGSDIDLSKARTSHIEITSTSPKAVSKKDMIPYNNLYCSEAQKLSSDMSTGGKITGLLFGIQWDLACKFLEVNGNWDITTNPASYYINQDSISWGNYSNSSTFEINSSKAKKSNTDSMWESVSGTKSESMLLTTGATEYTNKMNIYDFAGNEYEWSLEHATMDDCHPCSRRGGYYNIIGTNEPASYRGIADTAYCNNYYSFRSSLY